MYPKRQIFFVLGLSRSGKAAAEFLLSNGAITYIYDDIVNERVEQTAEKLKEKGAKRVEKEDLPRVSELCDILVLSPGVPIDHPIAVAFKRAGKSIVGETELASRYMRCPIIAVTGTNGKTTTVSMLTEVLNAAGLPAKACGNIGAPMIDFCGMSEREVAVSEISSFQLETLNSICPHVSVVLNISEDHLNRHYNMENYIFLKGKLLKNQTEAEYAVLNYDDLVVRAFAEKTKAKVLYFSVKERVRGAFYEDGYLWFGKEKIMSAAQLPATGLHNVQNALAVIIAAKIMGVKNEKIVQGLAGFKGIKHRVELIAEINGVRFVDDSKGTNVDATLKAISCMQSETVILLGGKNKGYDYDKLFAAFPHSKVVHAVLYGENRYALLKSARAVNYDKITLCEGFDFAVRVAVMKAQSGQTVLLSPASASFDEFASYEERGEKFVEIVQSLYPKKELEIQAVDKEEDERDDTSAADEYDNQYDDGYEGGEEDE